MSRSLTVTRAAGATIAALVMALPLQASGPLGIYGIVERVVFEPDDRTPERVQVWGAFSYVAGANGTGLDATAARRGYLYFSLPPGATTAEAALVKNEWSDLRSVAGTGQAVGFGTWHYAGAFNSLDPARSPDTRGSIFARGTQTSQPDLRVRPRTEPAARPTPYQTNAGIVKLSAQTGHAGIIARLQAALKE
ncbi:MAG TPA: hypothetical protein VJP86_07325 [Vicinamibacterales bacterium]|nr:hypothetical protein [Vicinamibacterales bacterium]